MASLKYYFHILLVTYSCSFVCGQYNNRNRARRGPHRTPLTTAIPLTNEEHEKYVMPLIGKGWFVDRNISAGILKMKKDFTFKSFFGAFGFMTNVAMHCEETNHFPEWFNVYKVVKISLTTKHIKSLSINDVNLANYIERVFIIHKDV